MSGEEMYMKFGILKVKRVVRITPNDIPQNNELNIRYSIPIDLTDVGKDLMRNGTRFDKKHILSKEAAFALYKYLQTFSQYKVIRVEDWEVCETIHNEFYLFVDVITSV